MHVRARLCVTETPVNQIEDAFKAYTARDDVAVILITQVRRKFWSGNSHFCNQCYHSLLLSLRVLYLPISVSFRDSVLQAAFPSLRLSILLTLSLALDVRRADQAYRR